MKAISTGEIASAIKAKLIGNSNTIIENIIIDSRTVISDKKTLFIALKSERNNGHNYIKELYNKGIINFIISEYHESFNKYKKANFIITENSLNALQELAKYYRNNYNNEIISITGSNGKTVTKEWLYQLLQCKYNIVRSPKSYNSQIGVALSLMLLENKYDLAIIEAGISKPGEMGKLQKLIEPHIGVFTNIGNSHQKNFSSIKQKITEKLELFKNCDKIIYCSENKLINKLIKSKFTDNEKLFTWSTNNSSDLQVIKTIKSDTNTHIKSCHNNSEYNFNIPFTDNASIENAINCLAYLIASKKIDSEILKSFSKLSPIEMRLELKEGINNCTLINDYYNSDLSSLKIALDYLSTQKQHKNKTIILTDIFQSDLKKDELYKKISKIISQSGITKIIGIGKNIKSKKAYFDKIEQKYFFDNCENFMKSATINNFKNETILIKGSRKFELEKISEKLIKRKHRTILEINLSAITNNLNYYKSKTSRNTKIMVMVKAFSYGSGSYEIANLLQEQKVDYLGVAFTDEGVKLREAGISLPIIVMNPEPNSFINIIDYKLEPEIYNFTMLHAFAKSVDSQSVQKTNIHLKIDTGMKRLGFCDFEISNLIEMLKEYKQLRVKSIFSHLAGTDEEAHDEFTKSQIMKFEELSNQINGEFNYEISRHILNSSGIERFHFAEYNMVRLGIGLYGFSPNNNEELQNVSTLRSTLLQIKNVNKGESIGYSRKYIAKERMKIAIIPIGYADGFNRKLSNGVGQVLIDDKLAPVVGNICMDMSMIDVTNLKVKEGDEVIIFGDKYPASIIAQTLNTIPYEIITGISERVKRVYYKD